MASLFDGAHPGLKEALDRSYQRQLDNGVIPDAVNNPRVSTDVEKLVERLWSLSRWNRDDYPGVVDTAAEAADALATLMRERDELRYAHAVDLERDKQLTEALATAEQQVLTVLQRESATQARHDAKLDALERRLAEAVGVVRDMCNPLAKLRRDAEAQRATLSGMAYQIANDINTIQEWGRAFLTSLTEKPAAIRESKPHE